MVGLPIFSLLLALFLFSLLFFYIYCFSFLLSFSFQLFYLFLLIKKKSMFFSEGNNEHFGVLTRLAADVLGPDLASGNSGIAILSSQSLLQTH